MYLGIFLNFLSPNSKTLKNQVRLIKDLKPDSLELLLDYPVYENQSYWLGFIKKNLQNYQILVHAPFLNISLISLHQAINRASIKILKWMINFSQQINCQYFTIHAGDYPFYIEDKKEIAKVLALNLKGIIDYGKRKKVEILLENLDVKEGIRKSFPTTKQEITLVLEYIPNLNLTFDVGHAMKSGIDPFAFFNQFKSRIKNIHLHNVKKKRDHQELTSGNIDIRNFFKMLQKGNYDGFLTPEPTSDNFEGALRSYSLLRRWR